MLANWQAYQGLVAVTKNKTEAGSKLLLLRRKIKNLKGHSDCNHFPKAQLFYQMEPVD